MFFSVKDEPHKSQVSTNSLNKIFENYSDNLDSNRS